MPSIPPAASYTVCMAPGCHSQRGGLIFCIAADQGILGGDAAYLASPPADVPGAAALTEQADVPAGIRAGADRSPASADPLLATDSPRRVRARQGLLAGLALAVLAGVIVFE